MIQQEQIAISFTCIGIIVGIGIASIPRKFDRRSRSKEDRLVSILESMVFLLLHSDSRMIRGMVAENYRGIERATKNDGLADMEVTLKGYHAGIAREHEHRMKKDPNFHGRYDD